MKLHKIFLFLLLGAIAVFESAATDNENWCVIGDGQVLMPVSSVSCLVGSDATGLITVVGKDVQIPDIKEVAFAVKPTDAISAPQAKSESVTLIHNILTIKHAAVGSAIAIRAIDGRTLYNGELRAETTTINVGNFAPGIYLVTIGGDSTFKIKKR